MKKINLFNLRFYCTLCNRIINPKEIEMAVSATNKEQVLFSHSKNHLLQPVEIKIDSVQFGDREEEKMSEKICKHCGYPFIITDSDMADKKLKRLYSKIIKELMEFISESK